MNFSVYHAQAHDHDIRFQLMSNPTAEWIERCIMHGLLKYTLVAEVETISIGEVYRLTNTIHHDWWLNRGVTPKFTGSECRSTSVGDVVTFNRKAMLYIPVGMAQLSYEKFQRGLSTTGR